MWREAAVKLPLSQNTSLAWGAGVADLQDGQTLELRLLHYTLTALIYEYNQLASPRLVPPPGPGS